MTAGLFLGDQPAAVTPARSASTLNATPTVGHYANPTSATLSRIAATRDQSAHAKQSRTPVNLSQQAKKTSASLHNLSNLSTNDIFMMSNNNGSSTGRHRRDSYASTVSSVGVGNTSINSTPSVDYKENKAYELRKKSALMNKIAGKGSVQIGDPIYTRSHPVSTELAAEQQQQQHSLNYLLLNQQIYQANSPQVVTNNQTSLDLNMNSQAFNSSASSSAARKRLFAKKNERNVFDPNASIQSNTSSASSSTGNTQMSSLRGMNLNSPRRAETKVDAQKARSKSTTFNKAPNGGQVMASNSTQDLIELINQSEAPQGDLESYQLMLSECERFVHSASNKTLVNEPPANKNVKIDVDTFANGLIGNNEVYSTSSLSSPFSLSPSGASNSPNSMIGSSASNQSHSPVPVNGPKRREVIVSHREHEISRRARSVPYEIAIEQDELDQ